MNAQTIITVTRAWRTARTGVRYNLSLTIDDLVG